ncbi:barstar family protein [Budvicia diplopodorum]|uniref:barstar family protein n=1 Tax=Budvicia diplopodorum TaxID=1119056 RepID=UPI00135A8C0C|nr:barstar family protein [Budvicia diplopodorum]
MRKVIFDFSNIHSMSDFYLQFVDSFLLPDWFGNNLDALWDVLTVQINFPVEIVFLHFDRYSLDFRSLFTLLKDAEEDLDGQLTFLTSP